MRLVSLACAPHHVITFEGHALTVIEADAYETQVCFMNRHSSLQSSHLTGDFVESLML